MKYLSQSRDYMRDSVAERSISWFQIIEVRVQCVVVDMHVNQPLQKKKIQSQTFLSSESMDTKT